MVNYYFGIVLLFFFGQVRCFLLFATKCWETNNPGLTNEGCLVMRDDSANAMAEDMCGGGMHPFPRQSTYDFSLLFLCTVLYGV